MKISKLRAALAVICVLTVSVLLVQNTLLLQQRFAMKSTAVEGETVDIDSDGVARTLSIKLGEFQADQNSLRSTSPSLFGILQQALRDTRANSSSANLHGNHTQRRLATSFRGNPMKVPLPPVESRNLATKQQDDPLIAFKTHVDEMKRKVAEIPKPKLTEVDNEPWEALWGRDNEFHYPYYLKKSRTRLTEIPPSVSALFPTVFSNTTLMSRPPERDYSFKKFENVFTDRNVDILKLLSHWDNLDVPFYANLPRLRFDVENPPPPKYVAFSPSSLSLSLLSFSLSLSLFSLSSLSLSLSSPFLSCSYSLTHSLSLTYTLSLSLSHTHTHTHTHFLTLTHTHPTFSHTGCAILHLIQS